MTPNPTCYPYINPFTPAPGAPEGCEDPLPGRGWTGSITYPLEHYHDIHPDRGFQLGHPALDFDAPTGTLIKAAATGSVIWEGPNIWGFGNLVILDHGGGFQTLYAHLDTVLVQCNSVVLAGAPIGTVGTTGQASFEHLHFEVRRSMNAQWWSCDPHRWFNGSEPPPDDKEETMLVNGDFELDWSVEESHNCLVIDAEGEGYRRIIGNIFTPPGWTTWFKHVPDMWDQPEVRDAHKFVDPVRVHDGEKAILMFSFYRRHDGGFLQQVVVEPGETYKFFACAHAWSNHILPGHEDCLDNPRCSCGVGEGFAWYLEGTAPLRNGEPWNDAIQNFLFTVGVDPTGGTNPYAASVIWGEPAHIYNEYGLVPLVIFEAEADVITVFLRSSTLFAFKHNDAYWDSAELIVYHDQDPVPERGQPRTQYERTYVLLPQGAGKGFAIAAAAGTHPGRRTIGYSADDAGIGDLDVRNIIAVNPTEWPGDLRAFYQEHYPGVNYIPIEADTPDDLLRQLLGEPPPYTPLNLIAPHLQTVEPGIMAAMMPRGVPWYVKVRALFDLWRAKRDQASIQQATFKYVRDAKPSYCKVFSFEDVYGVLRTNPDTIVGVRHFTNDYGGIIDVAPDLGARRWVDLFRDALYATCARIDIEFPEIKKPYYLMEGPNELYTSNNAPLVARAAALDQAIALEIEQMGLPVVTIGYCAGVGNPTEEEYPLLVPLARTLERTGGAMGLHLYWWASQAESGLDSWWKYHAGRYQQVDEVLVANGVHVDWLCGESGVVQSDTGHHLNAHSGYRDVMSWGDYLADILHVNFLDNLWNETHEGRFKGRAYFTTCAHFCNWESFWLRQQEFEDIARSLEGYAVTVRDSRRANMRAASRAGRVPRG